jgi:hypothetical protein
MRFVGQVNWQKSEWPGMDHMKVERQEKVGGERRVTVEERKKTLLHGYCLGIHYSTVGSQKMVKQCFELVQKSVFSRSNFDRAKRLLFSMIEGVKGRISESIAVKFECSWKPVWRGQEILKIHAELSSRRGRGRGTRIRYKSV